MESLIKVTISVLFLHENSWSKFRFILLFAVIDFSLLTYRFQEEFAGFVQNYNNYMKICMTFFWYYYICIMRRWSYSMWSLWKCLQILILLWVSLFSFSRLAMAY